MFISGFLLVSLGASPAVLAKGEEELPEKLAEVTAESQQVRPGWAHIDGIIDLKSHPAMQDDLVSVEDRVLIEEMFARYGVAFDERRIDVLGTLFAEDVDYEIIYASRDTRLVWADGREDMLSSIQEAWKFLNDQRRHHLTNVVLEKVDDTRVKAIAYGLVVIPGNPNVLAATAVYGADLVLTDGQWKFTRFIIATDAYQGR